MNKGKTGLLLGLAVVLLISVLLSSSFGAGNEMTTTNQKVSPVVPSAVPIPMKITGIKPVQASLVSNPDGTGTFDFIISGQGKGDCQAHVMTGEGTMLTLQITASDGFPKKVPITFSKPATYSVQAYGFQGCSGDANIMVTVQGPPEYPCSKYPGYKKDTLGIMTVCHINAPSVTPNPKDFNCPTGTKFYNFGGYMFGCMAPSWVVGQ